MTALVQIHLVRHGEAVWNRERKYQGQADSGLTDQGRAQADRVGAVLAALVPSPALVVASDLPRTLATAAPYVARVGVDPQPDRRWRELDVGTWAGRTFEEMRDAEPDVWHALERGEDVARGGGESFADARGRIEDALGHLVSRFGGATAPAEIVVFSHGGPIRLAAAIAAGVPAPGHARIVSPGNCSVTTLHLTGDRLSLARYDHDVVGRSVHSSDIDRKEVV